MKKLNDRKLKEIDELCDARLRRAMETGELYFCPWIGSSYYPKHRKRHLREKERLARTTYTTTKGQK